MDWGVARLLRAETVLLAGRLLVVFVVSPHNWKP
jgi:hypothetical protein